MTKINKNDKNDKKLDCKMQINFCHFFNFRRFCHYQKGFTLLEALISLAIFAIIALGVIGAYSALTKTVKVGREKTVLASLGAQYMEIVKNLPYSQVGTMTGNPSGPLPDQTNQITSRIESQIYRIFYEVAYIDDPADGITPIDAEPTDYKQVKIHIVNSITSERTSFTTNVVPQGPEGTLNAGALLVKVLNSAGQIISGADVHIESTTTPPSVIIDQSTDSNGQLLEVGLTAKVNGYHIVVTKAGYSTDQTYPITPSNPNPTKPDVTIVEGQLTEVTFVIDLLSTLNIRTLDLFCQNISGVNVNVRGAKLIGTNPDIPKYDKSFSSVNGLIGLTDIEWDTYTPTLLTGQTWVLRGTSPIQKIDVLPGTTQTFTMILGTNTTAYSLLVVVKDAATGAALENAVVHLRKGGSTPQDYELITGGSVWVQPSWVDGGGQANWSSSTPNSYYQDDANIDINSSPTGIRLKKVSSLYVFSGWLESSAFDTGTSDSDYTTLTWDPPSQSASTTLQIQVAANNDNATWDYTGPDGTSASYYTAPGSSISSVLNNNRYLRYKVYLSTLDDRKTPVITSLNANYVSGCNTPGQVWFGDLTSGNNYDLTVTLPGYQTQIINAINITGNQTFEVLMSP